MQKTRCTHSNNVKQGLQAWNPRCACEPRCGRKDSTKSQNASKNPHRHPNRLSGTPSLYTRHFSPSGAEKIAQNSRCIRRRGAVLALVWEGQRRRGRGRGRAVLSSDGGRRRLEIREGDELRSLGDGGVRMIDNEVLWGVNDVKPANHLFLPDAAFWGHPI